MPTLKNHSTFWDCKAFHISSLSRKVTVKMPVDCLYYNTQSPRPFLRPPLPPPIPPFLLPCAVFVDPGIHYHVFPSAGGGGRGVNGYI